MSLGKCCLYRRSRVQLLGGILSLYNKRGRWIWGEISVSDMPTLMVLRARILQGLGISEDPAKATIRKTPRLESAAHRESQCQAITVPVKVELLSSTSLPLWRALGSLMKGERREGETDNTRAPLARLSSTHRGGFDCRRVWSFNIIMDKAFCYLISWKSYGSRDRDRHLPIHSLLPTS